MPEVYAATTSARSRQFPAPAPDHPCEIAAARCSLLFVTAESNRSIPGVLKNAIEQASRPYGRSAWAGNSGGMLGVSVGAIGTTMAQ
jgi:chromate reductase